jgi:hypothetical protein
MKEMAQCRDAQPTYRYRRRDCQKTAQRCRPHSQGHAAPLLAVAREPRRPDNSIARQASLLPILALNHDDRTIETSGGSSGSAGAPRPGWLVMPMWRHEEIAAKIQDPQANIAELIRSVATNRSKSTQGRHIRALCCYFVTTPCRANVPIIASERMPRAGGPGRPKNLISRPRKQVGPPFGRRRGLGSDLCRPVILQQVIRPERLQYAGKGRITLCRTRSCRRSLCEPVRHRARPS